MNHRFEVTRQTLRRIRGMKQWGKSEVEIAQRLGCSLARLQRACMTHGIHFDQREDTTEMTTAREAGPVPNLNKPPRSPVGVPLVVEKFTHDAIAIEASRRGTTTERLAAKVLETVFARDARTGQNLCAAVLDL